MSAVEGAFGYIVCSGSLVVTIWTVNPGVPCSSPEWVPIFYEARTTVQGLRKAFISPG